MGKIAIRPVEVRGDIALVALTQGLFSVIDAADAEQVGRHNWMTHATKSGTYARRIQERDGVKTYIYLHRFIADAQIGDEVDHRDADKLNNRRGNLRFCSRQKNNANCRIPRHNTSGVKGVYWSRKDRRWVATISIDNKTKYLGFSHTKEGAAEIYRKAAVELHGEFARA